MLGGDLLVDDTGRLALPYYSKDNRDRPSMSAIFLALADARAEAIGEAIEVDSKVGHLVEGLF